MYVKLCNFGNYADEKVFSASKQQQEEKTSSTDVYKKLTLYRRLSAVLLILCVVLLAVLLALAVKMSEVQSSQECPLSSDGVEKVMVGEVCNLQKCERMFPQQVNQSHNGHDCSKCGHGWLMFEDFCYFLSRTRLQWKKSREECQKLGGDLVIISNERLQRFLTLKGNLMYWIGLSFPPETQQWTWINDSALITSYWASSRGDGNCALLRAGKSPRSNWYSNPCTVYLHYICQKG